MAVARWTFANLYSRFLSKAITSPSAAQTTEAKQYVNDGYLRALSDYEWPFLHQAYAGTLDSDDEGVLALPANFGAPVDDPIITDSGYYKPPRLDRRSPEWIQEEVSRSNEATGLPLYYAIREATFVTTTGSRKELVTYPWADTDYAIAMPYRIEATTMTADAEFPMGPSHFGPTILAAAFAVWEERDGDTEGVFHKAYDKALARSIAADGSQRAKILGYTPPERLRLIKPPHGVTYS